MAYTGTYMAYVKYFDGTKTEWRGLRNSQAKWRYNWIQRNTNWQNEFMGKQFDEFGFCREWQD